MRIDYKNLFGKVIEIWFVFMLIVAGFFYKIIKPKADTIGWDLFRWSRNPIECTSQFSGCDLTEISTMGAPGDTWHPTSTEKGTGGFKFRVLMGNNTLRKGTTYQFKIYYSFSSKSFLDSYTIGEIKANTRFNYIYTNTTSSVPSNPNYVSSSNASFDIVNQEWSEHTIIWYINYTPEQDIKMIEFYLVTGDYTTHYLDDMAPIFYGYTSFDCSLSSITIQEGVSGTIESSTENIINNNNSNTQSIINNNNTNTQSIINNNNTNTQNVINSNKVCDYIDKNDGILDAYLNSNGNYTTSNNTTITDYIKLTKNDELKILEVNSGSDNIFCFYNVNKNVISCNANRFYENNQSITIPDNTSYVRFTINKSLNKPTYQICKNGNQAITDTITSDSVDDPTLNISQMSNQIPTNGVITQLVTLPIQLYSKVLNSINGTCTQFVLGSLYGTNLIMPCIDIDDYLGSSLWSTIDLIISGLFVYHIARKFIKVFNNFTSLKEGDVIGD